MNKHGLMWVFLAFVCGYRHHQEVQITSYMGLEVVNMGKGKDPGLGH